MAPARSSPTRRTRRARGSLSAAEILDATATIVSRDGLHALSMPTLGRELGAGVTSIYWYFRSKEELLVALCRRAMASFIERLPAVDEGRWDESLLAHFRAFRAELHRVPGDIELLSIRPRSVLNDPEVLALFAERLEPQFESLVAAGATPMAAVRYYAAGWSYTHGFALLEHAAASDPVEHASIDEVLQATGSRLRSEDLPRLSRAGTIEAITNLSDAEFERGLAGIIAGIRLELDGPGGVR